MDVWNAIFSKGEKGKPGGPLSAQQCAAASAVFGADDPEVIKKCPPKMDKAAVAATITNITKQLRPEISELLETIKGQLASLSEDILSLDERLSDVESDEIERKMFTSRMGSMMFSDNPSGHVRRPAKPNTGQSGWTDDMVKFKKRLGQATDWTS